MRYASRTHGVLAQWVLSRGSSWRLPCITGEHAVVCTAWAATEGYSHGTHRVLTVLKTGVLKTGCSGTQKRCTHGYSKERRDCFGCVRQWLQHSTRQCCAHSEYGLCGTAVHRVLTGYSAGNRIVRICACAAPTPAPTNVGDTNPPTRMPTTFAPNFADSTGERDMSPLPSLPLSFCAVLVLCAALIALGPPGRTTAAHARLYAMAVHGTMCGQGIGRYSDSTILQ